MLRTLNNSSLNHKGWQRSQKLHSIDYPTSNHQTSKTLNLQILIWRNLTIMRQKIGQMLLKYLKTVLVRSIRIQTESYLTMSWETCQKWMSQMQTILPTWEGPTAQISTSSLIISMLKLAWTTMRMTMSKKLMLLINHRLANFKCLQAPITDPIIQN